MVQTHMVNSYCFSFKKSQSIWETCDLENLWVHDVDLWPETYGKLTSVRRRRFSIHEKTMGTIGNRPI